MRYDSGDTECNEAKLQTAPLTDADVKRAVQLLSLSLLVDACNLLWFCKH